MLLTKLQLILCRQRFNLFKTYAQRYMRLVPTLMFLTLVSHVILKQLLQTSPFIFENEAQACRNEWWMNLLLIQNVFNSPPAAITTVIRVYNPLTIT